MGLHPLVPGSDGIAEACWTWAGAVSSDARLRAAGVDAVDVPYGVTLWVTRRLP